MKTSKKNQRRIGTLLFFVPMLIIIGLVVYAFIQVTAPGTLVVNALGHDSYVNGSSQGSPIQASFTVVDSSGKTVHSGTTEATFSLSSGTYTVTYGSQEWYTTPSDVTIAVPNGMKVYSVGVYQVIPTAVSISQSGFNSTQVSALEAVTPVIWINNSGQLVILSVQSAKVPLEPGQNYTRIFQNAGSVAFSEGSVPSGTLQVVEPV